MNRGEMDELRCSLESTETADMEAGWSIRVGPGGGSENDRYRYHIIMCNNNDDNDDYGYKIRYKIAISTKKTHIGQENYDSEFDKKCIKIASINEITHHSHHR
jgi:hypothetical protein